MEGFTCIKRYSLGIHASLLQTTLEANGIEVFVIDKRDSSYQVPNGYLDVFVRNEDAERASTFIPEEEE